MVFLKVDCLVVLKVVHWAESMVFLKVESLVVLKAEQKVAKSVALKVVRLELLVWMTVVSMAELKVVVKVAWMEASLVVLWVVKSDNNTPLPFVCDCYHHRTHTHYPSYQPSGHTDNSNKQK